MLKIILSNIDKAISVISEDRAKYGATMNRLDHAMANMAEYRDQPISGKRKNNGCRFCS